MSAQVSPDILLAQDMGGFFADPLGFVRYAYPWGKPGTILENDEGPREWQAAYLRELGEEIRARGFNGATAVEPIQDATSSGHGIGKSALTAMLVDFIISTRPFCKGVVTANTSTQLETKTWAEIVKWTKLCITGHWFHVNTGRGAMRITHKQHPEAWRVDAQTCRKENSEAFAGLHAANSTPFYIFDEGSAIEDVIWEVASGGLTDGEPMWFVFGNPTRNSGRFRECFGRQAHRWKTRQIDSREVEGTNKELFKQWSEDYGEDSDFVRVRVKGQFPRASSTQFIPTDLVTEARRRDAVSTRFDPLVMGVDVARFGDDQSVIRIRQGRDARSWPAEKFRNMDTMDLASRVANKVREFAAQGIRVAAIFVDGGGVGGGVVDRLRQLGVDNVFEVNFGGKAADPRYALKGDEMWGEMREWLKHGGAIDDDNELEDQLIAREYGLNAENRIKLEKKDDMKKRGLMSPDDADALALTFAMPVSPAADDDEAWAEESAAQGDYDPLDY